MQSSNNQKTEKYLSDVNFHLQNLKQGVETLQLDYNLEKPIYLFCERTTEIIDLISKLLNEPKLSLVIQLANNVNELFSKDENLREVVIRLINQKRPITCEGIAYLKYAI